MLFMTQMHIMNKVTTAELRNQFRRVSAWIDNGDSVEILKHGKPYSTLVPVAKPTPSSPPRIDFAAQRQAIWKGRHFSAAEVAEMRAAELEGEEYGVFPHLRRKSEKTRRDRGTGSAAVKRISI